MRSPKLLVALFVLPLACADGGATNGFDTSNGGAGGAGDDGTGYGTFGSDGGAPDGGCFPDPGNIEVPGNDCDEDGDGSLDAPPPCDSNLSATGPASDFAKALGLCKVSNGEGDPRWGVVSATFTGGVQGEKYNDAQHGIATKFGNIIKPREGASLGVLSSGYARECDDPTIGACGGSGEGSPYFKGYHPQMTTTASAPPGYPKATQGGCGGGSGVFDAIGVKLVVKVPNNAKGFSFDFDFYSGEWPEFVCTLFNDGFVAWLTSEAFDGNGGDYNVSFDSKGNPVSVNNGFFDRCTPNTVTGCLGTKAIAPCPGGPDELLGTGFYDLGTYCSGTSTGGGATGWLTTNAPARAGELMTLHFLIWDTGDPNFDSSVLVDDFQWTATPGTGTHRPTPK